MFYFNVKKAAQATALLMKQSGKDSSSYYKLIKLLYIAERESLQETGRPITGDRTVAMPYGPALSHICDFIRGEDTHPEWAKYFKTKIKSNYTLEQVADPGDEMLCKYEIDKLTEVAQRFQNQNRWEVQDITHKFLEYKKNDPGKTSKEIPVSDILAAAGKQERTKAVARAANADRAFAQIFGR